MYTYKAQVTNVVDGDTFDATVDVGFSISVSHRFRLMGIDTPETWRPKSEAERKHGMQATEFVKELILNKEVTIRSHKLGIYGRYAAEIYIQQEDGPISLETLLIANGFEKKENYKEE